MCFRRTSVKLEINQANSYTFTYVCLYWLQSGAFPCKSTDLLRNVAQIKYFMLISFIFFFCLNLLCLNFSINYLKKFIF